MQDDLTKSRRWFHVAAMVLCGLYAGVLIGCSFLATPVKFLAPTLSRKEALDVGRFTFGALQMVEWGLAPAVLIATLLAWRLGWRAMVGACIVVIVAIQTLWLLPALDARVRMILADQPPAPSYDHLLYGIGEILKVLMLLTLAIANGYGLTRRAESTKS